MPTPFLFTAPRDARTPAIERLEWLTDVQTASNGVEARRGLRAFPRHTYSFDVYAPNAASKESMQALRSETSFLVPLWQHVFERPEVGPDAGISALNPQVMLLDERGQSSGAVAAPVVWTPEYGVAAPCALARYAGDQRSFAHQTWKVSRGAVAFRLEGFQEVVAPYGGLLSAGGLPVLDPFTGAGDGLAEQVDVNANASDNGLLDLWEARYLKRSYTLRIVLNSRGQILEFRRLLFALRGRLNPLRWSAPGDAEQRTWRLASDAVELSYLRPGLATCSLSLTELSE